MTMLGKIFSLFACVTVLVGCSSNAPDIRAICLRDDIGNYVIKWETNPVIEGTVKMFVSDDPENFDNQTPIIYANIKDGVATYITNDNIKRKYFRLTFNDRYSQVIGARYAVMDSIQNLRDMGGYFTPDGKMTRWGKVFRSGQLDKMSDTDSARMDNLGIKTIIDLRTYKEVNASPIRYTKANITHIPITVGKLTEAAELIQEGKMRKGDALVFMQDEYLQFISDNTDQFAKILEQFQNRDNYPILVCGSYGKDRIGFAAAMLLAALDASHETIISDYLASNGCININQLAYLARELDSDAQESMTVFLTAYEDLMELVFQKIRKDYGSTEKYLVKGLHLSEKKKERLKDMLLY